MAHTVALFFLLHPSLCLASFFSLLLSLFFLVSVTASDSGWQPPGFLKANITAKDELQVCQTCKHALITHFSSGWQWGHWNNCCYLFFLTPHCTLSENDRLTDAAVSFWTCSLSKIILHLQMNKDSLLQNMIYLLWPSKSWLVFAFSRSSRIVYLPFVLFALQTISIMLLSPASHFSLKLSP